MPVLPVKMLIIATRNRHKVQEIRAILGDGFRVLDLNDFPEAPKVVEDAETFTGNATKKAVELARWLAKLPPGNGTTNFTHGFVLADDSGLEVDALNGAPGVHSARYAAMEDARAASGNTADADNNAKLMQLLQTVPLEQRSARFRCVLALAPISDQPAEVRIFDGTCEGHISYAPSGHGGFGYDPLFVPVGYEQSFADLGEDVKNRLSHRFKALEKLRFAQ